MQEKNNGEQKSQGGLSWSTPQTQPPQQKPFVPPPKQSAAAPAASGSATAKYAGMVVVGVIAGVVLAWGWSSWRSPAVDTAQDATQTPSGGSGLGTDTGVVGLGSNPALTIVSPQPAGDSVAVASAVVAAPTWVVVYEDNNGKPGNALGAALFFPGTSSGTVELLRSTSAGKTYLAARQTDNGDRKFSLKDDQFLTEGGEVQWVTFETN